MAEMTDAPPAAPVSSKTIKKLAKPDKQQHDKEINKIQAEIKVLQDRTTAIRSEMDAIQSGRGGFNEEIQQGKAKFNEIRSEKDKLIQERNAISAQLKAQQGQRDSQTKNQKEARSQLKYTSAAEIEEQIGRLKYRQETQSMSLSEEKKIIKEIEQLQQSKKLVQKFADSQSEIEKCRGNIKEIRALHDKKNAEIDAVQAKLSEHKKQLDELYQKQNSSGARDQVPKLLEERKTLKAQLDEKYALIRTLRTEFKEKTDQYYENLRQIKEIRKEEQRLEQERQQAEYELKLEEYKKELAKLHPYQDELDLCQALLKYLEANYGKELSQSTEEDTISASTQSMALDGMKPLQRKEEDFIFVGSSSKSKKGKKKSKKAAKLSLPLAQIESFNKIGLLPPSTVPALSESFKAIKERYEYFNKQTEREDGNAEEAVSSKPNEESKPKKKNQKYNPQKNDFPSLNDAVESSTSNGASWGPATSEGDKDTTLTSEE